MSLSRMESEARTFAKQLILDDVKRGVSEEEIRHSLHGQTRDAYWADIGGWRDDGNGGRKRIQPSKIVVSKLWGNDCLFVFSLHELYQELKGEIANDTK